MKSSTESRMAESGRRSEEDDLQLLPASSDGGQSAPYPSGPPVPEQFDIMVTTACNAKCAFCVQEATFKASDTNDHVFLAALGRHFREYFDLGGRRVVITGGEPLLAAPRVLAVLAELSSYELAVKALYTNGERLLRPFLGGGKTTLAEALADAGLGCVNLSVHHFDNAVNSHIFELPVKPSTEIITDHLQTCGLPFRFNLTLQLGGIETYDELQRYVCWAAGLGAKDVYVRDLFKLNIPAAKGESGRDSIAFSQQHRISTGPIIERMKQEGAFTLIGRRAEAFRDKVEYQFIHAATGREVFVSCLEIGTESRKGLAYLVLMPDGNLYRGWLGDNDRIEAIQPATMERSP